jgi:predicted permease
VGLAYAGLRLLIAIGPANLPRLAEISINPLVLAFALGISLLSGLFFGFIPVLKYAGQRIGLALRAGGRTSSQSRERHRLRNTLVVVQVALALVLLVSSGLMIRTFQALRHVDPGFRDAETLQSIRVNPLPLQARQPERVTRMQQAMLEKLAAIPGVESVGFASSLPMEGLNSSDPIFAQDKDYQEGQMPPVRRYKYVSPDFLATSGTRLIAGRDFTWTDLYDRRPVAMVAENVARELWGSPGAALGKRIRQPGLGVWREVVGVAQNVHDDGLHRPPAPIVYWPALMDNFFGNQPFVMSNVAVLIRTRRAGSEGLLSEVRQAVWSVNPDVPLARVQTMQKVYDTSLAATSFTLVMLAIAASMALVLGLVGIYGVIAYVVSQRTREIGIRLALGAQQGALQNMFVRQGLTLAAAGVAIGVGAAAALTRLMGSMLFGISPLDPMTYTAVPLILVSAAMLASYVPARRAAAVDPVEALRAE